MKHIVATPMCKDYYKMKKGPSSLDGNGGPKPQPNSFSSLKLKMAHSASLAMAFQTGQYELPNESCL